MTLGDVERGYERVVEGTGGARATVQFGRPNLVRLVGGEETGRDRPGPKDVVPMPLPVSAKLGPTTSLVKLNVVRPLAWAGLKYPGLSLSPISPG